LAAQLAETIDTPNPNTSLAATLRGLLSQQNKMIMSFENDAAIAHHKAWWAKTLASLDPNEGTRDSFWKAVKKLRTEDKKEFPSTLTRPDGVQLSTRHEILNEVERHFTSAARLKDPDAITFAERAIIHATKRQYFKKNAVKPCKKSNVQHDELHAKQPGNAARTMPRAKELNKLLFQGPTKKAPGPLGDTYELWRHCGPSAQKAMCLLFQMFWLAGHVPPQINTSYLTLVPKPNSDQNTAKGYRPITLLNAIVKSYETVLLARLTVQVSSKLSRLQHSGRKGEGTPLAIQRILNTVEQNKRIMLATVDLSKAFDRINHDLLFQRLTHKDLGVPLPLWKAIRSTYTSASTTHGQDRRL
jgi:hypothetical protein